MVSRGRGRQRISTDDLSREVGRLLDRDPDLSRSAITRELRGRGIAVGSERIRAVARVQRAVKQAQRDAFRQLGRGFGGNQDILKISLTTSLESASGLSRPGQTLQAAGAVTREGTRADRATFAAIDWRVSFTVRVFFRGQFLRDYSESLTGRTIQDLRRYNRDLVEAQIQNQIQGRLYQMFESPDDSDLYSYNFTRFDIEIVNVELRGDSTRTRPRTRRNG